MSLFHLLLHSLQNMVECVNLLEDIGQLRIIFLQFHHFCVKLSISNFNL
jgi:hypothetical protein